MSDTTPTSEESSTNPAGGEAGPGMQLAAARKSRGLTQEEVGDSLNLAPQTVEWLETDNYEKLPASAFTQGYLRNYAKHLSIDPDVIIAAYQQSSDLPSENWTAAVRPARTGFADYLHRHPGVFLTGACVVVGLLVLALLIAVWPEASEEEAAEPASTPNASVQEAIPAPATTVEANQNVARETPGASAQSAQPSGRFSGPVLASQRVAATPAPEPDANDPLAHIPIAQTFPVEGGSVELVSDDDPVVDAPRRVSATGDDLVRFEFAQDCWFEVNTLEGEQLYANLGRGGEAIELIGAGPFRLVIGFAPGVELSYNGQAVDVTPHIRRNNRASLVVGR